MPLTDKNKGILWQLNNKSFQTGDHFDLMRREVQAAMMLTWAANKLIYNTF